MQIYTVVVYIHEFNFNIYNTYNFWLCVCICMSIQYNQSNDPLIFIAMLGVGDEGALASSLFEIIFCSLLLVTETYREKRLSLFNETERMR